MHNQNLRRLARTSCALATALAMAQTMLVAVPRVSFAATGDLTITNANGLASFRDAVNAGTSYEGATVTLSANIDLSVLDGSWTPIGTADAPFCGTFTGDTSVREISGLQVSGTSHLGLFGYVGSGGSIQNIAITNGDDDDDTDDSAVVATSSESVIENVGSLAGYVYGAIGNDSAAIKNCSSQASVTVTSTFDASSASSGTYTPEQLVPAGTTDDGKTIERIGGLVGYCAGSISDSTYEGQLSVSTSQNPYGDNPVIAGNVGGIVGQIGGYETEQIVADEDEGYITTNYPDGEGGYEAKTSTDADVNVACVTNCTNMGSVSTVVDGDGGTDRFGEAVSAKLLSVGGLAGFGIADFASCTNDGVVNSPSGDGCGGIVGCLRGVSMTGYSSVVADGGTYLTVDTSGSDVDYTIASTGPTLELTFCENSAAITGLHAVGGLVGQAGTYTSVAFSKNVGAAICGVRWNKPMVGGITGQSYGDISHCYDTGDVTSKTGAGYYVAGIVGAAYRYLTSSTDAYDSPAPDISGCFVTGQIAQGASSYRQAGICGDSEGYIHDCYFITDHVLNNTAVATDDGTTDEGTVTNLSASDMQEKSFVALVNATTTLSQYQAETGTYYVPDFGDESDELNSGYPIFAHDRSASSANAPTTLIASKLSYSGTGVATYSATVNPVPTLSVTYDGSALVQGADYYVIPDSSALGEDGKCQDVSKIETTTFNATIAGIGDYTGSADEFSAPYTISKGDFSSCTASIVSKTYNFLAQFPESSDITIYDASGDVVDASEYAVVTQDTKSFINFHRTSKSDSYDGKSHVGYQIKFTANDDSNYEGTTYGFFQITKAPLIGDNARFGGFDFNGEHWDWSAGANVGGKTGSFLYQTIDGEVVEGMSIVYCGEYIKPTVSSFQYVDGNGDLHDLVAGTDYKVVYGDPGRDDLAVNDNDDSNTDVGDEDSDVGLRPCVTVRYVAGDSCNFSNYQSHFFTITAADVSDSSQCTVSFPDTLEANTNLSDEVSVTSYTGVTLSTDDYEITTKTSGTTTIVTLTGTGNLTGSITKEYENTSSARKVKSITINVKKVTAKKLRSAIKKAGGTLKSVKTVTLGKKVKKIAKKAFAKTKVKKLIIKTKKLTKKSVKGAFKGSKLSTVQVRVGTKKLNKRYVKKYRKIFTKKVCGKKVHTR